MTNSGFIFLLILGSSLLAGILATAHISAYRLNQRRQQRLQTTAAIEPELDLDELRQANRDASRKTTISRAFDSIRS